MKIEYTKVTWYSKLLALILFIGLPFLGFYLGSKYEKLVVAAEPSQIVTAGTTSSQTTSSSSANTAFPFTQIQTVTINCAPPGQPQNPTVAKLFSSPKGAFYTYRLSLVSSPSANNPVYFSESVADQGLEAKIYPIMGDNSIQALAVFEMWGGAGTQEGWHIISCSGQRFDRASILAQLLKSKNYNVFELGQYYTAEAGYQYPDTYPYPSYPQGYSYPYGNVNVVNNEIVETIQGYSNAATPGFPDKPGLEIHYTFTGSAIKIASVKEVANNAL